MKICPKFQNQPSLARFRQEKGRELMILAFALALRLLVLFSEGDRMYLGTDDDNYRESAEILLSQGVLTYAGWGEPTVFIMPGYPVFLAGVFAAVGSTSWLAVRIVQVFISLAGVWFGMRFGTRIGGRATGTAAGLLLAVYPPNLTAPEFLLTETLFTTAFLAGLLFFLQGEERRGTGWFILAGVMLGLATYFRPTAGLLSVVFAGYLLLRRQPLKRIIYAAGVTGTVLFLCLTPWIIRNYMIYHEFIPFTVSGGNPFLRGTYIDNKIDGRLPWVKGDRILTDRAQMEYGRKRFKEGFAENPHRYLHWYTVGKFRSFWDGPYYYKELSYLPTRVVRIVHGILIWSGLAGVIMGLWRRKPPALLVLLVSGYFTVVHQLYLAVPRYAYPVVQLAIIMAAYFIVEAARSMVKICSRQANIL